MNIHWKYYCWCWNSNILAPDAKNWLTRKDLDDRKDWRWEKKGLTEDEMVGWHRWLDGHEFVQALGVESDTTERLNWTELSCLFWKSFVGLIVWKYFLPFCRLSLCSTYGFLCCAKAYKFDVSFVYFCFYLYCLGRLT